ncbi:hypothetical protein PV325_011132 [Microctonus aethiopoides]|uniref:FAM69 protein-kinase domain-containing protein n=1 Tax=Microctonus aethiopoides TaxID=144406 RepID=A0AA39FMA3_9HYME|nr:hypothetical protein PV325_011132 [Microctonus aethiopoides]KAK0171995.1 hypothetical protein PV328_005375 [Microctonus aethiopoides]
MGETKIVVKKLAHDFELEAFDNMICDDIKFHQLCWRNKNNINEDSNDNINYNSYIESTVSLNFSNDKTNGLTLCPTTKHLENIINQSVINNFNDTANLWTIININAEPIILTILSSDDGWPVPKYYGACGRIIIESYVGLPLTFYYNEPWLRRAKIALYLLEAAQMFTFGNDDYAFYLTDISADNIAIDNYDKPKFVDLENIFILNKNSMATDQRKDWNDLHVSDSGIECDNCFVFSPRDICSHRISDHNYYAICQHILYFIKSKSSMSEGFLHDIPKNILNKYSQLEIMLNECAIPTIEQSRISAGDKLQKILREIVEKEK